MSACVSGPPVPRPPPQSQQPLPQQGQWPLPLSQQPPLAAQTAAPMQPAPPGTAMGSPTDLRQFVSDSVAAASGLFNLGRAGDAAEVLFDCTNRCIASPALPPDCRQVLQQALQRAATQYRDTREPSQPSWQLKAALDYMLAVVGPPPSGMMPPAGQAASPAMAPPYMQQQYQQQLTGAAAAAATATAAMGAARTAAAATANVHPHGARMASARGGALVLLSTGPSTGERAQQWHDEFDARR